ncbi:demethoxyubiquinone hydroxylase family protein [Tahibacter amnicola]|uniref:Demethoxyubiquinone hydroxylase family protein n=1 Tax=Tahibacter amnicola TaxID=2976241 RepID=A0ABY6BHI1_9GAMM|nr:demethoxyubiquinone hydroxylase family protein [Tahibacter amnicola]UXI69234.1 demethoxyubiquinone hydroxylase family protein [Tahibacter amnicola]
MPGTSCQADLWPLDIQRVLRVDHSGESGAIGIYQAQHLLASLVWPQGRGLLQEKLAHERAHRAIFKEMLDRRGIRPCRGLFVWRLGGWALGLATALLGRCGILTCMDSVEKLVVAHMEEQAQVVQARDPELFAALTAIALTERQHRNHGPMTCVPTFMQRVVSGLSRRVTRAAIRLSMST